MPHHIYELFDPRTNEIKYVGRTSGDLEVRRKQHIAESTNATASNVGKQAWMQQLLAEGIEPQIRLLETINNIDIAKDAEAYYIRTYVQQGKLLVNHHHAHYLQVKLQAQQTSEVIELDPELDMIAYLTADLQRVIEERGHTADFDLQYELNVATDLALRLLTDHVEEDRIITWYHQHFEPGGLLEGQTPTPIEEVRQFMLNALFSSM
jgi:hypothetical protein